MDYFSFDLQLFADTTFPADGYYTVTDNAVNTATVGIDTEPSAGNATYLHIATTAGVTTWKLGKCTDGTYTEQITPIESDIDLTGLVGTAEATKTVVVPASIGNLGNTHKIICTGVDNYVSISGLAIGATVKAKNSLAGGAITVNGVAFTGIKAAATSTVTFTVGDPATKVSAKLETATEAVTTPAAENVEVKVGETTYTTGAAAAMTIECSAANVGKLVGDGTIKVAQSKALVIGDGVYTATAEGGATLTAAVDDKDNTTVTFNSGAVTVSTAADAALTKTSFVGTEDADALTIAGTKSVTLGGGISLLGGNNGLNITPADDKAVSVTGAVTLGAGNDTVVIGSNDGTGTTTLAGGLTLGAGTNSVTIDGTGAVTITGGITGGAGADTYNLKGENNSVITINNFGKDDVLKFGETLSGLTITDENKTYVVTAANKATDEVTLYAPYAEVASAPFIDYKTWLLGAGQTRQIKFTADGTSTGAPYVTLAKSDETTISVTVAAAALGKVSTVNLGTADVKATIALASADMYRNSAGEKKNTVTISIGGRSVQLMGALATAVEYTAAVEGVSPTPAEFVLPANAVITDATGKVTVNGIAYDLGTGNNAATMEIEGVVAANTDKISLSGTAGTAITMGGKNYALTADDATLNVSTGGFALEITEGALTMTIPADGADSVITANGAAYTLKGATAARDLTVAADGTVSKMDNGDIFTIGAATNEYTVVGDALVFEDTSGNAFTVYSTGTAITNANAAFKSGTGLTVSGTTSKGEVFKSYSSTDISEAHVLALAALNNNNVVQYYGTTAVEHVATLDGETSAANVAAAYDAAMYKVKRTGAGTEEDPYSFTISGGLTEGTATTVNVKELGVGTIKGGSGLNAGLVNFVTNDTAFTVTSGIADLVIAQKAAGTADVITGAVALTLTGTDAQKLNLTTVGASAKVAAINDGDKDFEDVATVIDGTTYYVLTEGAGKTATVKKGEAGDTVTVTAGTNVKIGAKYYAVSEEAVFSVAAADTPALESGTVSITDATLFAGVTLPMEQNGDPVSITAKGFTKDENAMHTTVQVVAENGIATTIKGFGDIVGETITVGGYDYRVWTVDTVTTIQRKVAGAAESSYINIKNIPTGFTSEITVEALTDVLNWDTTATAYALGGTKKNELSLTDTAFTTPAFTTTRVFNVQKDGVTVAVLRQTAKNVFSLEKAAGVTEVDISIQGLKLADSNAIVRTSGFVDGTDTISADVPKAEGAVATTFTLNGTQYDIPAATVESIVVTGDATENGSKLVKGSVTLTLENPDTNKANNSVTVKDGSVITIISTSDPASASSITVSYDGVVSTIGAHVTGFSITNAEGITTTYTIDTVNTKIIASNGYIGEYSYTTDFSDVTITSTTGKSNVVKEAGVEKPPVKNGDNELSVPLSEGEYVVVMVEKNGSTITNYTTATQATAPTTVKTRAEAADGDVIGYFYTKTDAMGKTTVTYSGDTIGMPVDLNAASIDTTANLDVVAEANDLEVLTLTDVAAGQIATLNGVAGKVTFDNEKAARLSDEGTNFKITLVADPTTTNKFEVKKINVTPEYGVTNYKILAAAADLTEANNSYFKLTKDGNTYTISYVEGTNGPELTDATWANLVIDATAINATVPNGSTKIVIEPAAGIGQPAWADEYKVENVKAGVAVQDAQGNQGKPDEKISYINPVAWTGQYAEITGYPDGGAIALANYFTGANAKAAVYFEVTSTTLNGVTTITLGDPADAAPTPKKQGDKVSYLKFSRTGTVITSEYVNDANIPLHGLNVKDGAAGSLKLAVSAAGLTLGTDAAKKEVSEINITDNTAAPKFVDYNLTNVPGGVVVTGKTADDTVTFVPKYTFDIDFDLSAIATGTALVTKKYQIVESAQSDKGVITLTVEEAATPSTGYFTVLYNATGDTSNTVTVTYTANGGLDLNALETAGKIMTGSEIKINAGDLEVVDDAHKAAGKLVSITVTQGDGPKVNNYVVTDLANTVDDPSTVVIPATVGYLYEYTYASDKVVLGDLQPGETKYFVVTKAKDAHAGTDENHGYKGQSTYSVAAGVTEVPAATANYITAKNVKGVITLSYHQSTTKADAIDLAEGVIDPIKGIGQITVDASGLENNKDAASKLVLAEETKNIINYNVAGLPYSLETIEGAQAGDATKYRDSFTVTDQSIALTNGNLGNTVYYEVKQDANPVVRGKHGIVLEGPEDRQTLSGLIGTPTENEIENALKKKNYFTVTTSAAGAVSITYTQATAADAPLVIDLSGAGFIGIDANGATADKITAITIEKGAHADYQLTEVRGATTITNLDEGGSTVDVKSYETTYEIDGKIELSATGTGIVYYDVVRSESDTKIVTYKLGAASATHSESNYFAVNYNNVDQGKVFVSYTNVGTADYDLTATGELVEIDAAGLPKGVTVIDISERPAVGAADVYYELTNVPAAANAVDAAHGIANDVITKALDYAFAEKSEDVAKSVNITLGATVTKDILAVDVKNTAGIKIGEKYYFVATDYVPAAGEAKHGTVTITKTTPAEGTTFTVVYAADDAHDVVKLSGGQIALDASAIGAGAIIVKGAADKGSYAITKAPGGTTFKGLATDGSDTVKYSTTFTTAGGWVTGTYFAALADNIEMPDKAVVPATGTTYLAVTYDGTEQTVQYAWMTPNEKNGVMEELETPPTFAGRVTIPAPEDAALSLDASGFGALGVDIVGVYTGSNISKLGSDTTVSMTPAAANDTMTVAEKIYTANAKLLADDKTANVIKVSNDGAVSGVVKITKAAHGAQNVGLTAANKKSGATSAETVWFDSTSAVGDGVIVTFGANGIESISDLDAGEVVRIVEKDGVTYSYTTTNGLLITRTNTVTGEDTVLGLTAEGETFFASDLTYKTAEAADSYTTGFSWLTTGTQYVTLTAKAGTGTINTSVPVATKTATAGEYLLAVTVTSGTESNTLTIAPKVVNGVGKIVDAEDDAAFTGTVTLDAATGNTLPVILDVTGKTYALAVTGAKAGSSFTGLGAEIAAGGNAYDDSVATAALAKGEFVTVNGGVYKNNSEAPVTLNFIRNATDNKVWGLNATAATELLVTANDGTLATFNNANKAQTVSYAAGSVSDGAVVTINSTAADAVTSIEGLTGGESVTVTLDGVKTTYTANDDGTVITQTITKADGTVNTKTKKDVEAGTDVLEINWAALPNTVTNTLDWTKDSIGYFKITNNVAAVAAGETTISSTDTDKYVAAKVELDAKTGVATLTLTGKDVAAGVVGANYNLLATDTVKVTLADGTLVDYTKGATLTTNGAAVQISGAAANSVFAGMTSDKDQVTTTALAANDVILFNNKYVVSAAADNALTIAGNDDVGVAYAPRLVAGSVQVGGKYAGTDEDVKKAIEAAGGVSTTAYGSDSVLSVAYAEGKAKDGVTATFTKGNPTSITGLTNGESVTVTYTGGATYTYTAKNEAGTEIECVYVKGLETWTRYCTAMTAGGNILDGDYKSTVTTSVFEWTDKISDAAKAAGATTATGYFVINPATGLATVLDQVAATQTTVIDPGTAAVPNTNHYISVKASKDDFGVITLGEIDEVVVGVDGTISSVAADKAILKNVTLQLPADTLGVGAGTTIKAAVPTNRGVIDAVTMTNVGAGSVLSGRLTAADKIVTGAAFAEGAEITVNDTKYIAGADAQLTLYGDGKVQTGTLKLNTRAANGLSEVTTYYVDGAMNRISQTVSYSTTEKNITGAVVTVLNGRVTGLTQLGANEKVTIVNTTTDKNGIANVVTTTYSAALDDNGALIYTKTVDDNGKKTVSTNDTASAASDMFAIGWDTESTTAKSQFDWTKTGYFLLGEYKYEGEVALATQENAVSINKSKAGNVYLEVKTDRTGNSAKGYTVTSMQLIRVNGDGSFTEGVAPTGKVAVTVTSPGAGLTFPVHNANIVLNVEGATAGKLYDGLAAGETIAWSSAGNEEKLYVNTKTYESGAAGNAVTLKLTDATGNVEVTQGTLKVGNGKTLNSSVTNGATVVVDDVATKDGVIVTYGADGHVSSMTDLEDTETVTITETKVETIWEKAGDPKTVVTEEAAKAANKEKAGSYLKRVITTTIAKAYTAGAKDKDGKSQIDVVVTTTVSETLDGVDLTPAQMKNVASRTETWTKKAVAATEDVVNLSGFTTAAQFDWTATKEGFFAIEDGAVTVAAQDKAPEISTSATYLKVKTTGTSTAATAEAAQIVAIAYDSTLNAWVEKDFAGTITIPATGGIDVSAITNRALESYNFAVTDAATGKTFTGFTADDTIATAATFYAGNTITIGAKVLTAAAEGQLVVTGEGKAVSGTFRIADIVGKEDIYLPKNAAGNTYKVEYADGGGNATVVVKDGAIQEIRDVEADETVTVTIKDKKGNTVSTETYVATAGAGADETKITRTVEAGVTTTISTATLKASEKYGNIYGDSVPYTQTSNVTTSHFDWTDANYKDGYFAVADGSTTGTYTATVANQPSDVVIDPTKEASKPGTKYLKVTRKDTAEIEAISLVELQSDGSFRDVTSNLGTGSVVEITAPAAGLKFAKSANALYGVQISTPAANSEITGLKAVDAIGKNGSGKYEAGKAFGIATGTTLGATGMTIATAAAAMNVVVNGMRFVASDAAGLTIQANSASDTFMTKGTIVLDTDTTVATNSQSVMIQKLVKAVPPATEDTTGDKITVTAADTNKDATLTVDIYGSFDATAIYTASTPNAAGLTISATNTAGTVIEKYAVDAYGNITATNAAGSTRYALTAAPTGKITLDGTIDGVFDTAALVLDAACLDEKWGTPNKVTLLDNSRSAIYVSSFAGYDDDEHAIHIPSTKGQRLLTATYNKETNTYAIASDLAANNITEIDTTALTGDKVTINSTNLTDAKIKLTDAKGTTAVVKLTSGGTMALEAGAISGVPALTLTEGELVNASGLAAGASAGVTIQTQTGKATVNGVTYKDAWGAVVSAVKDGDNYVSQFYSGNVTVATGDSLALTGGSKVSATGSVQVTAAAGAVTNISNFKKGETVVIRTGTTTVTYEAISEKNIKVTTQPDGGAATVKTASYNTDPLYPDQFNPAALVTYDALTTEAGNIDWASTTAKTTYRLVPNSGTFDNSTVDLSAASKQTSFSYEDAGKHLFATTVQAGANTLTVTVNEIVVANDGSLTTASDIPADHGKFTLTTASLAKGTAVTLNGASTTGAPHTYTTAKDGAITLEGDGDIVNGAFVLTTTLTASVDRTITLANPAGAGTANTVTVANGKVAAISGLDVGESVTIGSVADNVKYTAQTRVVEGETIYEIVKTVTKNGVVDTAATATATVTKETMANEFSLTGGLAFTSAAASVDNEVAGFGQGQFQWTTDTRGVGYFLIQKASAAKPAASITVADQASKTVFTTKETGNIYMVASLDKTGANDVLTLDARRATVTTDEVTFSDTMFTGTVKLTVAKDYTGRLAYDAPSDRPYNVEFSGVTKNAVLTNLGAGLNGLADKVTTVSLEENDAVEVNGIAYTAGAKNALTFQNGKLYAGTVKITQALANSIVTTGNAKKGTPSMTVSGANFVGDDTNEVIVKVANGEITSITGLVNAGESITVTSGTTEYVYSVLDSAGTMIKRESDGVSSYTTIKAGGNIYVTNDKSWNPGVTFGPGGNSNPKNTTATADSKFWSGTTVRYYRIGTSKDLADGVAAQLVTNATEGVQGEYYIAVTAKETKTGAQITSVTLMQVSATGELKKASTTLEKSYNNGRLDIEAETALVYSAPATRTWNFNITGLKDGSKITNLNTGDTVTTGEVAYQGTVTVDNLKYVSGDKTSTQMTEILGGKTDVVTSSGVFAVSNNAKTLTTQGGAATYKVTYGGGKDEIAVTVSNGEVTGITGLGTSATSGTVTAEKMTADGKEMMTFTLAKGVITRTYTDTTGKEITTTAALTAGFDLLNGDYNDDATLKDVAYNFTWTDAGTTGYFKVANLTKPVTVNTAKGTIKTTDTSYYLAVELENAGPARAKVKSITIQRMERADNEGMKVQPGLVYTGALTLAVPKGIALTFDRSELGESMENAKIAITGVAAGSDISNLKTGELVTTGALAEDEIVTVNGNIMQSGAKSNTLKVSSIDAANVKVESGRVKLTANGTAGYVEEITVAKDKNTNSIVEVTTGSIIVSATATGFTVEGLGVGEEFTVTEADGTTTSYKVSENTLLRVKNGVTSIYKMNASTISKGTATVTSAILYKETNWLASTAYGDAVHKASTARAKIDLKAADTDLTKRKKAGTMMPDYYFVTDEAVDQKTVQTKNGVIATTMVATTDKQVWELKIGAITTDGVARTYEASDDMGQNILAAAGWSVTGGSGADTITGATSGKDTLIGGSGNDSMVGGAAEDYFVHTGGSDVIKSYASGKDTVEYNGFDAVALGKSDVTLGSSENDMLVLLGATASQANAVTIVNNGAKADYFFGKSNAAANFTKLTDGAYYYGQAGQNNKITLATDKTKATSTALGLTQTADLQDTVRFHNIVELNASGSANKVYLRANNAAATDRTTLRGGTYMTTLIGGIGSDTMFGGSGNDFYQFNEYSGTDVISKYDGKKDTLYVAGGLGYWDISDNKNLYLKASAGDAASIKVENAVGGTAVNVAEDAAGNNVTSYFFGKTKAANTYTGTDHLDVFFVNQLATATTVKLFGVTDEIRINVSRAGGYTVSEVMAMMTSSSGGNSVYNIEGQKLTISDKSYTMSTSNTTVEMNGNVMTIKRTK